MWGRMGRRTLPRPERDTPVNRMVPEAARLLGLHETRRGAGTNGDPGTRLALPVSNPLPGSGGSAETKDHSRGRAALVVRGGTGPAYIFSQDQGRMSPQLQRCALSSITASLSPYLEPSGELRAERLPTPTTQVRQAGHSGHWLAHAAGQAGAWGPVPHRPTLDPPAWPRSVLPFRRGSGWRGGAVGPSGRVSAGSGREVSVNSSRGLEQLPEALQRPEPGCQPSPRACPGTPLADTHLLVHVGVDPLLALQPLGGHGAQLLLGALEPLQQRAVRVLAAAVMRRGPQPADRGL